MMDALKFLLDAAKVCFPSSQRFLERTASVSWGTILFFLGVVVAASVWIMRKISESKLEQAKGSPPQSLEPDYKAEHVRFPQHGVMYTVKYRADKPDDFQRWLWIHVPQCLQHATDMVPYNGGREPVRVDDWHWWHGRQYNGWRCEGCGHTIRGSTNKQLEIEAKSRVMKRIKPEVFAGRGA